MQLRASCGIAVASRCAPRSWSARGRPRRCRDAVEHQRQYRDLRLGTDRARLHAELRDGPGRRLRRCQRNRRRLSAVPRQAARQSMGLRRRCGCNRRISGSHGRRSRLSDGRAREPATQYAAALAAVPAGPRRMAASPREKPPPPRCSPPERTTAAIRPRRSRSCSGPRQACGASRLRSRHPTRHPGWGT